MDPRLLPLFERAFGRGPAREANARIQAAREALAPQDKIRSYEIVVPSDPTLDWFSGQLLPRLVYHLESLGARPPKAPGVFLSLFVGEEIVFIHARDVLAFATATLGLSADEMLARWGTGERRTPLRDEAPPHPPLALPGPKTDD